MAHGYGVTTLAVLEVLRRFNRPLSRADIAAVLNVTTEEVTAAVVELVLMGTVTCPSHGLFAVTKPA
jgi:hypothetical protein